jgi:hypothetical protein
MKKKLFSLFMAVAMIATLAIPALATPHDYDSVDYDGTTEIPTVTVGIMGAHKIALNPYGMEVSTSVISGGSIVSGGVTSTAQIVTPVMYFENSTEAPMKVGVKATATPDAAGKAILSAKPCTGKETTLSAFLIAEFQQSATIDEPTWTAKWDTTTDVTETINEKCYPQIIPTAEGKTAAAIYSLDRATKSGGSIEPNYLMTHVTGNLAGNPTGGWTGNDKVKLVLEFTFTPGVANTVTLSGSDVTLTDAAFHSADYVMGAAVRLTSASDKMPVVKDANDAAVTVTKGPVDGLYYFVMPSTPVTVTAGT